MASCSFRHRVGCARSKRQQRCSRSAAQAGRRWADILAARGVAISPLKAANSGFTVAWSEIFRDRFEGQPLKGVALAIGQHSARGEAIVTRSGVEGGAIYALSAELREAILRD